MINYVGSSAHMIKQSPTGGPRPFLYADKIDLGKPALVILGGALASRKCAPMDTKFSASLVVRHEFQNT